MSAPPNEPPSKWTLGQIDAMNLELEGVCTTPGCGWFCSFDVNELIERLGPDYRLPESGPGIACKKCGGREVTFQVAYLHPAPGNPPE